MGKEFYCEKEIKNKELRNVCKKVEELSSSLGKVSAILSVASKAGISAADSDAIKLCGDISCTLDAVVCKIGKHQEELEKMVYEIEKLEL